MTTQNINTYKQLKDELYRLDDTIQKLQLIRDLMNLNNLKVSQRRKDSVLRKALHKERLDKYSDRHHWELFVRDNASVTCASQILNNDVL